MSKKKYKHFFSFFFINPSFKEDQFWWERGTHKEECQVCWIE